MISYHSDQTFRPAHFLSRNRDATILGVKGRYVSAGLIIPTHLSSYHRWPVLAGTFCSQSQVRGMPSTSPAQIFLTRYAGQPRRGLKRYRRVPS